MQILPVIDLLDGQVVRGVAGRREAYRPIVSQLFPSESSRPVAEPLAVARAFRHHFGLSELYVADLDAIAGRDPALGLHKQLLRDGFELWLDAGLGDAGRNLDLAQSVGVGTLIAGLESLTGPEELRGLMERFGSSLVFSLDLLAGKPMARADAWFAADAWSIARQAIDLGVERILVLDLAGVGVGEGSKTADLCARLRTDYPRLHIATGGGVRGPDDLRQLQEMGVDEVLVASALHDGRLTRLDIEIIFVGRAS